MADRKRVVITGMGAVTPCGLTVEETWANITAGKSGIGPITLFDSSPLAVHIAGEMKGFEPGKYMDFKESRRSVYSSGGGGGAHGDRACRPQDYAGQLR